MMEESSECIGPKLAPFNPTGDDAIRVAIEMLELAEESILYDLGCGDGRLLTAAVKASGARGVGVEYDKRFADRALKRVADAQLEHKIDIVHGNVLDTDIDDATAVFVYLVPAGIKLLKQALVSRLHRGARVVTYGLDPVRVETLKATKIYLYNADSLEPTP